MEVHHPTSLVFSDLGEGDPYRPPQVRLAELLLLFHPESGELSATFIATAIILLAWRYFALKAPIEFDWRQRMTGLSLIPIALG
jgi:hypothetical protein